jgi:predicted Na+-dependent transporter
MSGELKFAICWAIIGVLLGILRMVLMVRIILRRGQTYQIDELKVSATLMVWALLWPLFCPLLFLFRKR